MPIHRCRHCSLPLTDDEQSINHCPNCGGTLAEEPVPEPIENRETAPSAMPFWRRLVGGSLLGLLLVWFAWTFLLTARVPAPETKATTLRLERLTERPRVYLPPEPMTMLPMPEPMRPPPPEVLTEAPRPWEEPKPRLLQVQYRCLDTSEKPNQLRFHLRIVNQGNESIPLTELTVRYWYTRDKDGPLNAVCDWATLGREMMMHTITEVKPVPGADTYIEIGFRPKAMSLEPRQNSGEIQYRVHRKDWSRFAQRDDYSLDMKAQDWTDAPKITLYRKGVLVWGVEPKR